MLTMLCCDTKCSLILNRSFTKGKQTFILKFNENGYLFKEHSSEKMPKVLYKYFHNHIKPFMNTLYKRKAFVWINNKHLYYIIPMRDIASYDVKICFDLVGNKSN